MEDFINYMAGYMYLKRDCVAAEWNWEMAGVKFENFEVFCINKWAR